MTRKRFIKLNMALGWSRNEATREAGLARLNGSYQREYAEITELLDLIKTIEGDFDV